MDVHVLTLFPNTIKIYCSESIIGRAQKNKLIDIKTYQLRTFVTNKWGKVDERSYGGGPGMVLSADVILKGVKHIIRKMRTNEKPKILLTSTRGKILTNKYAKKLSTFNNIIIICGRYEGIDARVKKILKAEEISIGPYVLTGGEIPALSIIDAAARQIDGVLGKFSSLEENRISSSEVYTRPETIFHNGKKYSVPKILRSGNHAKIEAWKLKKK